MEKQEHSFSFNSVSEVDEYIPAHSDNESATPVDTPNQSFYSQRGSYGQTPHWPQSYRQSMDIYSNVPSPSLSIFSPGLQRFGSSYLSSSFVRPKISPEISSTLNKPLIPSKPDQLEPSSYEAPPSPNKVVEAYQTEHGCSSSHAVVNGVNVLCGVGVLSTPFALKEGGWMGFSILFTFAVVSWYTGILLRNCLESEDGLETYPDIGQAAFGTSGRLLISIILYMELYACCVEFLILEGDNLSALFPHTTLSYIGINLGSKETFSILAALMVLPTVWLQDLRLLSYVSVCGVIASVVVAVCIFWVGVIDGVGFHNSGKIMNLSSVPVSIGLYGFCYSGHAVFPNIYSSLKDRSQFPLVLIISFIICTTIYASVAIMGYTMFGEVTESQITLNLPQQYVASKIAVWTTVVNPFTKYALTITPVALSLEELLPFKSNGMKNFRFSMAIRTALVISTLCVALLIPFFAYVMAFIGSFLTMLVCLIFPAACFLKIVGTKATRFEKVFCVFIIVLGAVCAVVGTYSSLVGIIQSLIK